MTKGKLIAFEGIDGAGKNTQLGLAETKLRESKVNFKTVAFPRYDKPSSYFINQYLNLEYPYGKPEEIGPYRASLFYALDRYEASLEMSRWLGDGITVLADRYTGSNLAFQGGKIDDLEERMRYVEWLTDLEYSKLGIPKADATIVLWLPVEIASQRIAERNRGTDGHEINPELLKRAQAAYLWLAKSFPEDYHVVKCFDDETELSSGEIHQKVWEIIKNELGI